MHLSTAVRHLGAIAGLLATSLALPVAAQTAAPTPAVPSSIRIMVGFAPGGGTDVVARIYAEGMRDLLKTNVIVENKPGAGGAIAAQSVISAPTNPPTLLFAIDHQTAILQHIMKNPGFDVERDLIPIGRVMTYEMCLAVSATIAAKTLPEFVAAAKSDDKMASVAVPAPGSNAQFIAHVIGSSTGVKLTPVPYRGAAPAMTDLAGGQIKAAVMPCDAFGPFVKSGQVRILAIAGDKRSTRLADVPTMAEHGIKVPGSINFLGAYASRGTDPRLVTALQQATRELFNNAALVERLNATGQFASYASPDDLARLGREASAFWAAQVKASGYAVE